MGGGRAACVAGAAAFTPLVFLSAADPPVFRVASAASAVTAARARAAASRGAALAARRAADFKEIRVGAAATDHDAATRLARAAAIVAKGWRVKLTVPVPRGVGRADAYKRLEKAAAEAASFADVGPLNAGGVGKRIQGGGLPPPSVMLAPPGGGARAVGAKGGGASGGSA